MQLWQMILTVSLCLEKVLFSKKKTHVNLAYFLLINYRKQNIKRKSLKIKLEKILTSVAVL